MSEKRPETSADIVSRSRALSRSQIARGYAGAKQRGYSVDLSNHMAECDANFHRLLRLFPDLKIDQRTQDTFEFALQDFDATVVCQVLNRGPYTTELELGLRQASRWSALTGTPQFKVRVYHDAGSAEVVSYQDQKHFHGKYEYPNVRMRQRDEKAQINRFLSEFLNLCLSHGLSKQPIRF
ncbi:MAG: DUF1249 domain-containing protein [Pseudomonadota bacterium]